MDAETDLVPLVLFLALAALFCALGGYLLLRPARAAAFFADEGERGRFRSRDARAVGLVFTVGGGVLVAVGLVRLLALVLP
ncbi:hypothetical protein LLS1_22220 [Leifsonia sp. LS1]|uniref:hypothetical protein n=1 Tax=Leifsonia sp. LS1 TaxID=2828483 RepID=UPI001CFDAD03|nr:hypothetical protein [Leifsonia sp. LS1]GIT80553.1 hypothetical protein LLS1_22220 [Leifsonia sp. LS1]